MYCVLLYSGELSLFVSQMLILHVYISVPPARPCWTWKPLLLLWFLLSGKEPTEAFLFAYDNLVIRWKNDQAKAACLYDQQDREARVAYGAKSIVGRSLKAETRTMQVFASGYLIVI